MSKYKHSDEVWHRVVQIIQEAMLMNVDCVDLLRQIEVQVDSDSGELALTADYVRSVDKMHEKWIEEAKKLQRQQEQDASSSQLLLNFNKVN